MLAFQVQNWTRFSFVADGVHASWEAAQKVRLIAKNKTILNAAEKDAFNVNHNQLWQSFLQYLIEGYT
jgi:hypothetical protein